MNKKINNLQWVSSLGGPLILMEECLLPFWLGDDSSKKFMNLPSDYERACEVIDYLQIISIGDKSGLILGDLPSDTSYFPSDSKNEFLLVRWIGADSGEQIENVLNAFSVEQEWEDSGVTISFESRNLVLFDSVFSGQNLFDSLVIEIEVGAYNISTLSYKPNDSIEIFLIFFKKSN
jgi:Immunity protein 21